MVIYILEVCWSANKIAICLTHRSSDIWTIQPERCVLNPFFKIVHTNFIDGAVASINSICKTQLPIDAAGLMIRQLQIMILMMMLMMMMMV